MGHVQDLLGGGGGTKTCSHILGDNEMTIVYSPNKDPSRGI